MGVVCMIIKSDSVDRTKYHITVMLDKLKRCYKTLESSRNTRPRDVELLVELARMLDEEAVRFTRYVVDVFGAFDERV